MKKSELNLEDILTDRSPEDFLEVPLTERTFKIFFLLISVAFIFIIAQVANLGIFKHSFYEKRAFANNTEIKIEPAPRGIVVDRFGKVLVSNDSDVNIFLVPSRLPQGASEQSAILQKVSEILDIPREELDKSIEENDWNVSPKLLIKSDPTNDELIELSSFNPLGVEITTGFKRFPSSVLAFTHVLGYIGFTSREDLLREPELLPEDKIGKSGLEQVYDKYLKGENGKQVFFRNAKGEIIGSRIEGEVEPGKRLQTFIDKEFQEYFYNRLDEELRRLGRNIGVGIALNPQNGEVLALVGIPSFDGTKVGKFLESPYDPLFNRATSGLYNPGSTIKPLVAAAALAEGVIDPLKRIFSAGFIDVPNPYDPEHPTRFLDWKPHGWVDLHSALARSSNVYFYEVGGGFLNEQKGLGIYKLNEWWEKFNLNQKTGIDLPYEKAGFLPTPEWIEDKRGEPWRLGDTYNVSIGQGDLLVTPLELLNYVSAIANGGKFYEPRIMKSISEDSGEIITQSTPKVSRDLSGELASVLPEVQQGMIDVVEKSYGTAQSLSALPMRAAVKTGTAQIQNNEKINALFLGYAPVENPQIAILVLVENAREGSVNTIPVAKDVFLWYYNNRLKH